MTGHCPHCGGVWQTFPESLEFSACCSEMEEQLSASRDDELDMLEKTDADSAGSNTRGDQ